MTAVVVDVPLGLTRQFARFSAVGIASTASHLTLFSGLTTVLGAQGANVGAALLTAVANTAVNRRFTFGVRGAAGAGRQHLQSLLFVALGLALTSGALALLDAVTTPNQLAELTVVVAANIVGALSRFALLRSWVFRVGPSSWVGESIAAGSGVVREFAGPDRFGDSANGLRPSSSQSWSRAERHPLRGGSGPGPMLPSRLTMSGTNCARGVPSTGAFGNSRRCSVWADVRHQYLRPQWTGRPICPDGKGRTRHGPGVFAMCPGLGIRVARWPAWRASDFAES